MGHGASAGGEQEGGRAEWESQWTEEEEKNAISLSLSLILTHTHTPWRQQ